MLKFDFKSMFAVMFLICAGSIGWPAVAAPPAGPVADVAGAASVMQRSFVSPAATRLCGRGLSGRCTKGRAACTRGTAADCAKWTAWSKACTKCATAFAQCRSNPKKSCESCIAAHDACEAKAK